MARRPWWTAPLVVAMALAAGACGQGADRETPFQPGPDAGSGSRSSRCWRRSC